MRRTARIIGITALLVLAAVAALIGCSIYSFEHSSVLTAEELQNIQTALKGEMGEALFSGGLPTGQRAEGTGLNALLPSPEESHSEGLIASYQHAPQTFKRYAQLFDTAINAEKIADEVQHDRTMYQLPISSSAVRLQPGELVDAWGHTYCVSALKATVIVVSGGPDAPSFSCLQQKTRAPEISSTLRNIFQASNGEVVVVSRQSQVRRQPDLNRDSW